jgi:DNA-binding cell septation regulator SpoVG
VDFAHDDVAVVDKEMPKGGFRDIAHAATVGTEGK